MTHFRWKKGQEETCLPQHFLPSDVQTKSKQVVTILPISDTTFIFFIFFDGERRVAGDLLALVLPDSELSKLVVDIVIAFGPPGGELSIGKNIGPPSAERVDKRL